MRNKTGLILLLVALGLSLLSFFGGDNFGKLEVLRASLASQLEKNGELRDYVHGLKREVQGLKSSDRVLEKAARNSLGMARENEVIFFFDSEKEKAGGLPSK